MSPTETRPPIDTAAAPSSADASRALQAVRAQLDAVVAHPLATALREFLPDLVDALADLDNRVRTLEQALGS